MSHLFFCERNREKPLAQRKLTALLSERGIGERRDEKARYYVGIRLLSDEPMTHHDTSTGYSHARPQYKYQPDEVSGCVIEEDDLWNSSI
jgi:hypothetical protein